MKKYTKYLLYKNVKNIAKIPTILNVFKKKNYVNYTIYNHYLQFFFDNNFKKFIYLFQILFLTKHNILFMDHNINFNYLPINNDILFSRSYRQLLKLVKFFNVGLVVIFNLSQKPFYAKKILNLGIIALTSDSRFVNNILDLNTATNNPIYNYTLYIATLQLYLKCKG